MIVSIPDLCTLTYFDDQLNPFLASLCHSFFLSIFTGSLIHEHYTRECEFGNFDKIKNKNNTQKNTQKNTKTFG